MRDDDAVNRRLRAGLDAIYSVGESQLKLFEWDRARRSVVVREEMQEAKRSLRRKLFEIPGYTFRLFLTDLANPPGRDVAGLSVS